MDTETAHLNQHGFLEVGDGHSLYWEDWGNPDATPIFHLHGGPGSGFGDKNRLLYDPKKHRVIFHDQRGAGRSAPFAGTERNTSQDLVSDIEKLRTHLGVGKLRLSGGSWGSTLALLYAIEHPERVERIVLWSLFLARKFEIDFVNSGMQRYFFPEAWERFVSLVPAPLRGEGDSVMRHYAEQMRSEDKAVAKRYADEWTLWESTLMSIQYSQPHLEKAILEDRDNTAVARIETHYFLNGCFMPENYLLDSLAKIRHIPCALAHGRFDMCTPAISAHDFEKAYGGRLSLIWVNSGHRSSDPEMAAALRALMLACLA